MGIENRNFSIPKTPFGGSNATIMVVTEPQRNAPKPSKSLFNNPLIVNARVPTAPRMPLLLLATLALLTGGMIYILWRPDSLLMFSWFRSMGLGEFVSNLRLVSQPLPYEIPNWVVYSLPQALWFFSGLLLFRLIWGNQNYRKYIFWACLFTLIAIGFELGQLTPFVTGYFDMLDLFLLMVAGVAAVLIINERTRYAKKS